MIFQRFCFVLCAFSGCGGMMGMPPYAPMMSSGMGFQRMPFPRHYGAPMPMFGDCTGESDDSPRCVKFVNNTNYHARCWLGDDGYRPVVPGPDKQWSAVLTFMPHQWDRRSTNFIRGRIRCEFYAGPYPLILFAVGEASFDSHLLTDHEYPLSYINPKRVM